MAYAYRAAWARSQGPVCRWRIIVGSGISLAMLQAMVFTPDRFGDFTPDLYSIMALYFALFASRHGRYVPSLALGLIRDFLSMGLIGTYGVLYSLLHKASEKARGKLDPDRLPNILIMAVAGTFLVNFGYHAMLVVAGDGIGWSNAITRWGSIALATGPFAVFLYPLIHFALGRVGIPRAAGGYWNI